MAGPRHTARGIVIKDGKLLLIERFRGRLHYHSIPGGGIEPGETPEQAVVREIAEETSCAVRLGPLLYILRRGSVRHFIYRCDYATGEAHLPASSPEAKEMRRGNRFEPVWLPLGQLHSAPFLIWQPIKQQLLHDLRHGFSDNPIEIIAEPEG